MKYNNYSTICSAKKRLSQKPTNVDNWEIDDFLGIFTDR